MSSRDYQPVKLKLRTPLWSRISCWLDIPLSTFVGLAIIGGIAFLNLVNVAVDKGNVGLDGQVMLKLAGIGVAGIYGALGFFTDRRIRDALQTFPLFWMVLIVVMYFISAPFSMTPTISFVSSVAALAVLLMTVRAVVQIGVMPVLNALFIGMSLFNVLSWVVYFAWPEIGVLKEPITGGKFAYRMSGLAHSNVLGQFTGLTVVLGTIMCCTYRKNSVLRISMIFVALGALVNSFSRTSLVATCVALVVAYRGVLFRREYWPRYAMLAVAMVVGILILSTQMDLEAKIAEKLTLVSKSGDAEELTSATGRSDIWAYAIRLIAQRPMLGYGAATSKFFLADFSMYTHNMILNVAFSTGIIGGIAALLMVLGRLREVIFSNARPLADGLLIFIIVNGLFENVTFSIIAGMPTIVWVMSLTWPLLKSDPLIDTRTGELKTAGEPNSEMRFSQ